MYHFFMHSSVSGHLGCFYVLVIVNSAAMNNGVHVSFSILVSSEYMPSNQSWKRYMYPNVHCNTIYNSYNRKQSRCPLTDEWIKNLWYICESESSSFVSDSLQPHGLSLSHKKECIWVSSNEMDEPRAYYTEWSNS